MDYERCDADDIEQVIPATDSARRVVELVKRYGKGYVAGELSADRALTVTGSEVPTICGENMFETSNAAYFKKVFNVKMPDNEYTLHGRLNEPKAINVFRTKTGAKVFFVTFMRDETYNFLAGTFDALAIMPDGEGALVEVKCPARRSISDRIPEHYIGQVQTYLQICQLPVCLFTQYKPAYVTPARKYQRPAKMIITRVARDPAYIQKRMFIIWDFYLRVRCFREGKLPMCPSAVTAIKAVWRWHRGRMGYVRSRLLVAEFRRIRLMYDGVSEAVEVEMNLQRPFTPVLTEPLVVVLDLEVPK